MRICLSGPQSRVWSPLELLCAWNPLLQGFVLDAPEDSGEGLATVPLDLLSLLGGGAQTPHDGIAALLEKGQLPRELPTSQCLPFPIGLARLQRNGHADRQPPVPAGKLDPSRHQTV